MLLPVTSEGLRLLTDAVSDNGDSVLSVQFKDFKF